MKAQRLPGKPLLKINGLSIISHVVKRAKETQIGEVIVATEDDEIIEDVKKNNGEAILTSKGHKSGTDRIWEAYKKLNIKNIVENSTVEKKPVAENKNTKKITDSKPN